MQSPSETRAIGRRCLIAGAIFLVLGLAAFIGMQMAQSHIDRAQEWPSVDGEIVTSEIATVTGRFKYGIRTSVVADIGYVYSVNGQNYQGEHLRLLPMLHMKGEGTPEEIVARYPVGRSVEVYYDPGDPSSAVLIPTPGDDASKLIRSVSVMGPCIAFLGLVLSGIGAMCVLPKQTVAAAASRAAIAPALPPVKLTLVQLVLRTAATMMGLFLFLIGSLILVAASGTPNPEDESVRYVIMAIFGIATLVGAALIYAGIRRPRPRRIAVAA